MVTFNPKPSDITILKLTDLKTGETEKYRILNIASDKRIKLRNIENDEILVFNYTRNDDQSITIFDSKKYAFELQEQFKTISITIDNVDPIALKTMSLSLDNLATQINKLNLDAEEKIRLVNSIYNVSNKFNSVASILITD